MSTKKKYAKGFKYSAHFATLIDKTRLVLENDGKFGVDRLEAIIYCRHRNFDVLITDGFTYVKVSYSFKSLKQALNHSHGWMVDFRKELNDRQKVS